MTQFEQLDTILEGQHGMLQTSEVVKRGIPKSVFYNYVKEKELEQAAHGVYVSPDAWVDGMYLLHLRCSQGIFSHETALFFHGLTDREPSPYSITVKRGYNTTRVKADGVLAYAIKPELHGIGKSMAQPPLGIRFRFMIWSGPSATCFAAGAVSRCRHCKGRSKCTPAGKRKTCGG